MKSFLHNKLHPVWCAVAAAVCIIAGACSFFSKGGNLTFIDDATIIYDEIHEDSVKDDMQLIYSNEYKSWQNTADTSFSSLFNGNLAVDVLAKYPARVILWAGSAFSKSYYTPIGHMHAIGNIHKNLRTGAPSAADRGPQPASCWACKSVDVPRMIGTIGEEAFFRKKWYDWGAEIVNPIGCADCHDPESMDLHVTRPFLTEALERKGISLENVSVQEMRSLVCAQCHSEYHFEGEDNEVVFPWDSGYSVEDIEGYYDRIGFTDFTHSLSKTPLLKAQHPDFELAQMGIHAQRGVSCGECHMPYIGEEVKGYNSHHIQSPLAMIDQTCQSCHRQSEDVLRQNVYDRQKKAEELSNRLEKELAKTHIEAKFAWDKGATEAQMKVILRLIREAQWRWDFSVTSHGASFHAPQEVERILGDGLYRTMQARLSIVKLLHKLGYDREVPIPDISTKEKAQQYIGLDMKSEIAAKDLFLKTVIPEWKKEAEANKRLIK